MLSCGLVSMEMPKGGAMTYDYVKRAYGVNPILGQRVRHTETKKFGSIEHEDRSASHYVQVKFDGRDFALPCHPTSLDYSPFEVEK